ncbi:hypothetical protein GK047_08180 [Paenibacillus sp. SYP-B3998]|uniref:Intracellular septation protein A n=1 Tax=Paenibacillus sp. SYP-B3998 TaxID=2678564 RepID=A0A6G3ZWA1_9BACL|nr:hypothetical protein [Paenibacillus sp. SYP-B3998]NEW05984.1 hypothetical protein [Paenibacillus sp. SYP-B3998]
MDFLLFMFFGILETYAIYLLAFRFFRFEIDVVSIVFACVIASFISFSLREIYGYAGLDIFVQLILVFLFIWQLFKVHVFYSALLSVTGFITLSIIQTILLMALKLMGFMQDIPGSHSPSGYMLQVLTAGCVFLTSYFIQKKRLGFTFVPKSSYSTIAFTASNRMAIGIAMFSLFPLGLIYLLFNMQADQLFFLIPISLGAVLFALLHWANKRELRDE